MFLSGIEWSPTMTKSQSRITGYPRNFGLRYPTPCCRGQNAPRLPGLSVERCDSAGVANVLRIRDIPRHVARQSQPVCKAAYQGAISPCEHLRDEGVLGSPEQRSRKRNRPLSPHFIQKAGPVEPEHGVESVPLIHGIRRNHGMPRSRIAGISGNAAVPVEKGLNV